jgi:hypothetical protein
MDINLLIHHPEAESSVLSLKRPNFQNPLCLNPIHNAVRSKQRKSPFRQRHTCTFCVMERIFQLLCFKTPKRMIVKRITAEFRAYFCPFCIMEADLSPEALMAGSPDKFLHCHCRKHKSLLDQKRCKHDKRWTDCALCDDPRAGSSFCACGVKLGSAKKFCCCKMSSATAVVQ